MVLSKYCRIFPHKKNLDSYILFSTKKASSVLVSKSVLDDIERDNLSSGEKESLLELGFLVQDAAAEKQEMLTFIDELNTVNTKFKAIVVLNLDCNLACKYCFEGKRKGKFYMTQETADLFIDFVKRRYLHLSRTLPSIPSRQGRGKQERNSFQEGETHTFTPLKRESLEEMKITFYGGEPLLSPELIIYISERLKPLAEANGIRYGFYLITNGTLLSPNVVKELKPFGLTSADITIDGPKTVHDVYRPFKSGKGSFDAIIKNAKNVCDMIDIHVGGNFTKENYIEFPYLLDYLIDNGLSPDRISSINFNPVIRESPEFALPEFTGGCVSIDESWLFDAGLFLRKEILRRGYRTQKIIPSSCMTELDNSLVVNYDGSLYKCPGFIGRQGFCIGDLGNGIQEYRQSHNLDIWKNEECLNCSYLPLCFGGCRYMKLLRDGNLNGTDCKKSYLDATLETLICQDISPAAPYQF